MGVLGARGRGSLQHRLLTAALLLNILSLVPQDTAKAAASESATPAEVECARHAPQLFTPQLKITLCKGATTNIAKYPGACAYAATRSGSGSFTHTEAANLCNGAASKAPAECGRAAPYRVLTTPQRIKLCKNCVRSAQLPPKCVNHAIRRLVTPAAAVELCSGSVSQAPINCFDRLWYKRNSLGKLSSSPDTLAGLCGLSTTTSSKIDPATCILELPNQLRANALNSTDLSLLCSRARNAAPSRCIKSVVEGVPFSMLKSSKYRKVSDDTTPLEWALNFCRGAISDGRRDCYNIAVGSTSSVLAATSGMNFTAEHRGKIRMPISRWSADLHQLCHVEKYIQRDNMIWSPGSHSTGRFSGTEGLGAAACFRHMPKRVLANDTSVVLLCKGALDAGPIKCATSILQAGLRNNVLGSMRKSLGSILEFLCAGASNDAPAQCLQRSLKAQIDVDSALRLCRKVKDTASVDCAASLLDKSSRKNHMKNSNIRHMSIDLATRICQGAMSEEPAKCARALPKNLPVSIMADICRGAKSVGPGQCALAGGKIPLLALKPGVNYLGQRPLLVSLCAGATSDAPVKCFQVVIGSLSAEDRVELCSGAKDETPARCIQAIRVRGMSSRARLELCRGAESIAPATCANRMTVMIGGYRRGIDYPSNGMSDGHKFSERKAREKAAGTFDASSLSASHLGLAHLCRDASQQNPDGPTSCFQAAPASLSGEERVDLCHKAVSDSPALCTISAISKTRGKFNPAQLIELCKYENKTGHIDSEQDQTTHPTVSDMQPEDCLGKSPTNWEPELRLALCRKAKFSTVAAVKCAIAISKNPGLLPDDELKLDLCLSAQMELSADQTLGKARNKYDSGTYHDDRASKRRARVNGWMSPGIASVHCVRQSPARLAPSQAVQLCKGTMTVMPAKCARAAPQNLGADQLVELCQDALSLTPAYCAEAVLTRNSAASSSPTKASGLYQSTAKPNLLSDCRGILPIASRVVITSSPSSILFRGASGDNKGNASTRPYLGAGIDVAFDTPIIAHVVDQFGHRMGAHPEDFIGLQRLPTKLIAVVEKGREMGASLQGKTVSGPTLFGEEHLGEPGYFVFANISMFASSPGILWLKVSIGDNKWDELNSQSHHVRPALVPIKVEGVTAPDHCWSTNGCNILYHHLISPFRHSGKPRNEINDKKLSTHIGFSGMVKGGAMLGLFCAKSLASHGVSVFANGISGNLILQGEKYTIGKIKSRVGAPHESMDALERLELAKHTHQGSEKDSVSSSVNASFSYREIKRAYRLKALEWHPDKWTQVLTPASDVHQEHQNCEYRVRNNFRLIIDAFNTLTAEPENISEEAEP